MITSKQKQTAPEYILGHSPEELERLIRQSSFYNPATEQSFQKAGIRPGMTVLDVGCGAGDLALIAARMVGPKGKVIAIDRAPEALALAEYRAQTERLSNIAFLEADLNEFIPDFEPDAIVGRLVLLYQADPVASLKRLLKFLPSGGLAIFQEFNMGVAQSWPQNDLFDRHVRIITQTFERAGMDPILGARLNFHLQSAGLKNLKTHGHLHLLTQENFHECAVYLATSIRSLLPFAEKLGVPLPEDLDLDRLPDRLFKESLSQNSSFQTPLLVSVWGEV